MILNDEHIFRVDSMARNGCSNQSVVLINLDPGKPPTLCFEDVERTLCRILLVSLQCGALLIAKLRLTMMSDRSRYIGLLQKNKMV
jgi:hypothetical protein